MHGRMIQTPPTTHQGRHALEFQRGVEFEQSDDVMDMRVGGHVRGATEFPVSEFRIRLDLDNFTHAQQPRDDFECLRDANNGFVMFCQLL